LKWSDKRFVKKVAEGGQLEIALAELALEQASSPDVRAFAQQIAADHLQLSERLDQLAVKKDLQNELAEYSVKTTQAIAASQNSNAANSGGSGPDRQSATSHPAGANGANKTASTTARNSAGTVSATTSEYDTGVGMPNRSAPAAKTSSSTNNRTSSTSGMESRTATQPDRSGDWNDPTTNRHYKLLAAKSGAEFDKEYISLMVANHEDDVAMFEKESKKADDADVRSFARAALPKLQEHLSRARQIEATTKS
jgi:predicted outer membrane protein